jgi:hypothetical protein
MMSRTPIGGLLLEAGDGWAFSVRDGTIAGKHGIDPGVLRVATLTSNLLPQPSTHEHCLQLAAEWVGVSHVNAADRQLMESVTGPYGSARYRRGKDDVSVWYCTRPPGLILGAYACPVEFGRTAAARFLRAQCARMIGSAIFDRGAWGGEDELTKFVMSEYTDEFPEHPKPPPAPPPPAPDASDTPVKSAPPKRRRS